MLINIAILFCSIPLFFSVTNSYAIIFSRSVDEAYSSAYFFTAPLGLLIASFIALKNIKNKNVLFLFFIIIIHALVIIIINYGSLFYVSIWFFLLFFYSFKYEFKFISYLQRKKILLINIYTLLAIQALIIFGDIFIKLEPSSLIINEIKIYNYFQYYGISQVLFLAVVLGLFSERYFFVLTAVVINIIGALHSENNTALGLVFLLLLLKYLEPIFKILKFFFLILIITFPIIVLGLVIAYIQLNSLSVDEMNLILNGRGAIWYEYYNEFTLKNMFIPMSFTTTGTLRGAHNIFLHYLFVLGPFLAILLYLFQLRVLAKTNIQVRNYIILVFCVSGVNLELVSNPYIAIQFALIASILQNNYFGLPVES